MTHFMVLCAKIKAWSVRALALVVVGPLAVGCTDGFTFGPPPTLDSADWSLVDREGDAIKYIRFIDPKTQAVERFTFEGVSVQDNTMDLSVSNSGLLAVRSGGLLTILNLSDKSVVRTANSIGEWIAWSNSGDRLAMIAGSGSTFLLLDAELNILQSRTLPFVSDDFFDSDFAISWSPDDSSIVASATRESNTLPFGTTVYEGIGLVLNSTDLDTMTEFPYATVYYLGDNLFVGTRYSAAFGLTRSEGSVHIFSMSATGIEEGDAIPNAIAVASSWLESGTFLTYENAPLLAGEFGVFHSWHRIHDTQGRQSELLGEGSVRYSGAPIKLLPRDLLTPLMRYGLWELRLTVREPIYFMEF